MPGSMNCSRPSYWRTLLIPIMLLLLGSLAPAQKNNAARFAQAAKLSGSAAEVIHTVMSKPEQAIPKELFDQAEAVAVFTNVKKVGFLIEGVSFGSGVVSRRTPDGWGQPVFYQLRGFRIGPQLEAKSVHVVLLLMNDGAIKLIWEKRKKPLPEHQLPVAGPVGEIRSDRKDVLPVADIFSYTLTDGRFAGQDLQRFFQNFVLYPDNKLNKAIYNLEAKDLLAGGQKITINQSQAEINAFPEALAQHSRRH